MSVRMLLHGRPQRRERRVASHLRLTSRCLRPTGYVLSTSLAVMHVPNSTSACRFYLLGMMLAADVMPFTGGDLNSRVDSLTLEKKPTTADSCTDREPQC